MALPFAETHYDVNNIIVGSATLYAGAVGAAIPIMPSAANTMPAPDPAVWTALGYTDAGITFEYSVTNKTITVDEEMAPVDTLPDTESVKLSMGIAELTLQNLNRAIAGGMYSETDAGTGTAGTSVLKVGSNQANIKRAYLLVGNGPKGMPRMINLYRAIATSSIKLTYKRAEKVWIPAEFTGLAYSANPAGNRLFQIVDKNLNGN